jgi:hypothetical protein
MSFQTAQYEAELAQAESVPSIHSLFSCEEPKTTKQQKEGTPSSVSPPRLFETVSREIKTLLL